MAVKREAFRRKQEALRAALVIGAEIARARWRELHVASLRAWQRQAVIARCMRCLAIQRAEKGLVMSLAAWRSFAAARVPIPPAVIAS